MSDGHDLPLLQDGDTDPENGVSDVWYDKWQIAYRDVLVLEEDNSIAGVFNLTANDLAIPENYNQLRLMLLNAATSDGDFDNDGELTSHDIDLLYEAIGTQTTTLNMDLTGEKTVDKEDASELVKNRLGTKFGDVDLDGDVDIVDFNFLAVQYDPDGNSPDNNWSDGNFDGDNDVDIQDFNYIAVNYDV